MPKKPSSASCFTAAWGNSAFASHWAACGAISFCANSRAIITTSCVRTSLVLIESSAALSAQPAGGDHFPKKRAGTVLVVAQPAVQDLENRYTDIQPDQIGERQRP